MHAFILSLERKTCQYFDNEIKNTMSEVDNEKELNCRFFNLAIQASNKNNKFFIQDKIY